MNNISKQPIVLIHCQYVYGIGHLVRTVELARGLSRHFHVFILNGGEVVPDFEFPEEVKVIQLPAIFKEENSKSIQPVDHLVTIGECFSARSKIIRQTVDELKPDILITEHFPFGLLFEDEVINLVNMVKNVKSVAKIVCSVRDLIESERRGKRDAYVCGLINSLYDLVLVHGDEKFAALSKSFPAFNEINVPIIHTGYIVRLFPIVDYIGNVPVILASVAGGRLGNELLDAVIASHKFIKAVKNHKLILFSGAFEKNFQRHKDYVASLHSDDIAIHKFDSNKYLNFLSVSSLIISLGGYNSIIESVSVRKPMLVYNREFAGGNEEQNLRIQLFETSGHLDVIMPEDLSGERLGNLIINKIERLKMPRYELNINGVSNSLISLIDLLKS